MDPIEYIKHEQNKFLNILEQNEQIQQKLLTYLQSPKRNEEVINTSMLSRTSGDMSFYSKKLPGLNKPDYNPFERIPNAPELFQPEKPIEKKKRI